METRPPSLSHQAPAVTADGWLPAPAHAVIMATLARIFAQLERLFQRWCAGALLAPAPRLKSQPAPARKPPHRRHAAPAQPRRRRAPSRACIISRDARTNACARRSAITRALPPANTPSIRPALRPHPARAPPTRSCSHQSLKPLQARSPSCVDFEAAFEVNCPASPPASSHLSVLMCMESSFLPPLHRLPPP